MGIFQTYEAACIAQVRDMDVHRVWSGTNKSKFALRMCGSIGNGQVIAAIAIGAPAERFESELPKLREVILDVAARLSGEQRETALSEAATEVTVPKVPRASTGAPAQRVKRARLG
jgi:hypothetical protein